MSSDFLSDPLWYKDAVIYELHVRSFYDANNDGFGDFEGLFQKLPYLESLGINTLWLLPFLKSPLRDDGYDISDYRTILPVHGNLEEFQAFIDEAHDRGMRVITELVLNHTSDQHPWFQEARDPDSPKHDWYVWSDSTDKYSDARIIFTDTEESNWTWDRQAKKYYWHRFFSHQPDLNYDNPEVHEAMKEVMFFWLDMGVDGLRLDAVPYLYELEGTNCENLPETLAFIRKLRKAIDERYGSDKVLLAEANQWPEDTLPYFEEGVQMAFNFPIMPRMYMALRRESRRPFVEMLELTKDIPEDAQWALFLRNHDELTLEMVTDEERDYMYHEYAADSRFRINVGIRRRLAPLLGGERRRIELMNGLLLSLKGSPVIYYGDEIGMGDDPFLGDRNGVRTPMQWSQDKHGGFSRAAHHQLFMPPVSKGPYSYEFVNVEDAEKDPHSLLNFMKRLLALRKQHEKVFGRGSLELIPVDNQSVLAFTRTYEDEQILVVANLSRFVQSALLPVTDAYRGLVPVELFGQNAFPALTDTPYHVLLGPHSFYWFALKPQDAVVHEPQRAKIPTAKAPELGELPVLRVPEGLENLVIKTMVRDSGMEKLEALLPDHLKDQRWFGSKDETIQRVAIDDAVRLQARPCPVYLSILDVQLSASQELYTLPLTLSHDEEAEHVLHRHPEAAIAWVDTPEGRQLLHDATVLPDFWLTLFRWWQSGNKGRSLKGLYLFELNKNLRNAQVEDVRPITGEQSNSSAILDRQFYVKLYRRLEQGTNPEAELMTYLTGAEFAFIPHLHGTLSFKRSYQQYEIGILQEALPVETDGWTYALEAMDRFLDRVAETTPPTDDTPEPAEEEAPVWLDEVAPEMLSLAHVLGLRTAELHLALAKADTPDLRPVDGTPDDIRAFAKRVRDEAERTRRMLDEHATDFEHVPRAADWDQALQRVDALSTADATRKKIRVHGDYHLGQVVRADGEFFILDFEGEPARSLGERRQRDYALRDVAGMLRSLEYAALSAWHEHSEHDPALEPWVTTLIRWCETTFMNAYYSAVDEADFVLPEDMRQPFLWAYLFDKALYEVRYELNHRPTWTWLPLRGLHRLLTEPRREASNEPTPEATTALH